jgi:hypothetical protein
MTDRELLEAAAKAAGVYYWIEDDVALTHGHEGPGSIRVWNPLTNDGDALRLAVKLRLLDEHAAFTHELAVQMGATDNPYAATRRAIVRAAAALAPKR